MSRGGAESGEVQGNIWGRGGGDNNGGGETRYHSGSIGAGVVKLDEGRGPRPGNIPGGKSRGGGNVSGGSPDTQGEEGIPGHWPCGGDVEGSGGNFKSPVHSLHHDNYGRKSNVSVFTKYVVTKLMSGN